MGLRLAMMLLTGGGCFWGAMLIKFVGSPKLRWHLWGWGEDATNGLIAYICAQV